MGRKNNAAQRKEEIIWALYECLAANGHDKVTVKDIAGQAGLAPGVIHYYFKSKDEIALTLAEAIYEKYSRLLVESIAGADSPEEKIANIIDFIVDNMIYSRPINRVFFNILQMGYERADLGRSLQKMFADYRRFLSGLFKDMGATVESDQLATLLVALTEGYSVQVMVDPEGLDREATRSIITATVKDHLK